ncbi:MAG: TonB-dependent receptor [Mucinivorans sp.]
MNIDTVVVRSGQTRGVDSQIAIDSNLIQASNGGAVGDLLLRSSNLAIKNYGRGNLQTASLRGTAPTHTTVYWNGLRVASPMVGMMDFSLVPTFMVDRVALQAGASSLSGGEGALGGNVLLNNRADWSIDKFAAKVSLGYGSFSSYDGYINIRCGTKKFQSSTRFFYGYSKNDFHFVNLDIIDPKNPGWHPTQANNNADYQNMGFMQEFYMRLEGNQTLSAVVWGLANKRKLPQLTTYEGPDNSNLTQSRDESLRVVINYKKYNLHNELSASIGADLQSNYFNQENRVANGFQRVIFTEGFSRSVMGNFQAKIVLSDKQNLTTTTSANLDYVNTVERIRGAGYEQSRLEVSEKVSLESQWTSRFSTAILVRFGFVGAKFYASPMVEAQYMVADGLSLCARLNHNTHYPTLSDMYYVPGGNADLKAEKGWTAELGLGYIWRSGRADVNVYASWIKDWIIWLPSHQQYWTPQNMDNVNGQGLELTVGNEWQIGTYWRINLQANMAMNRTVDNSEPMNDSDFSRGKQLVYVPLINGGALLKCSFKGLWLSYQLYGQSRMYSSVAANPQDRDMIQGYLLHNIALGYNYRWLGVEGVCENIYNAQIYTVLRRPLAPRTFSIRVSLKF